MESPQFVPAGTPVYRVNSSPLAATASLPAVGAVATTDIWEETVNAGVTARIDTGCSVATTGVVTDASIAAGDLGSPVLSVGAGFLPGLYVGTVIPATSFQLSSSTTQTIPVTVALAVPSGMTVVVGRGVYSYLLLCRSGQKYYPAE